MSVQVSVSSFERAFTTSSLELTPTSPSLPGFALSWRWSHRAPRGELTWPCGACLQVGLELGGRDLLVVVSDGRGEVAQARLHELALRLPFKGVR